jgi:hypothetical protein
MTKTYTLEVFDADDGSGDAILQFPDDFIETTGWKVGTELKLTVSGGSLIITEKKNESI